MNTEYDIKTCIKLKTLATEWVDEFWDKCEPFTDSIKNIIKAFDKDDYESLHPEFDTIPATYLYLSLSERDNGPRKYIAERFLIFGIEFTGKALIFLSCMVINPSHISMLVAVITHTLFANDIENKRIITYEYLTNIFEGKFPSNEVFKEMWDKQKLLDGTNLVDHYKSFFLLTEEESNWLAEHPEEEITNG